MTDNLQKIRAWLADLAPGVSPKSLLNALLRLGVAEKRPDGRINVPDIYRVAAKLLKRGGVKAKA